MLKAEKKNCHYVSLWSNTLIYVFADTAGVHERMSTSWLIGIMCSVALLTLAVLIACFVTKNKGGKYAGMILLILEELHSLFALPGLSVEIR